MSRKERDTLFVLERVERKEMKLVEGAEVLGITYRQCRRRYGRYKAWGAAGLVHRLRGSVSNHRLSQTVRETIVGLYREIYEGFGPVLFAEKLLSSHEIRVDHETVAAADKRRAVAGKPEKEKASPGMERAACSFWGVGADGWVASPLV